MTEPQEIDPPAMQTAQPDAQTAPDRRDAVGAEEVSDVLDSVEDRAERVTEAADDRSLPTAHTLAQLLAEAEAVHGRLDRTEREIQDVAEALLNQIADLEKRSEQALQEVAAQAAQRGSALEGRIEAAERARQEAERRVTDAEAQALQARRQQDVYKQAWQSAPLTLRLKFVRELLPDSHSLQNALKEAAALEELRRRGHDLEAWLSNYPALFADAAQALLSGEGAPAPETHPAEILAAQTLQETRAALETTLQALGITWVAPAPGDPVQTEHEVIGEESSPYASGRVARMRRRGFRFQGRLALPAQVLRATTAANRVPAPSEREQAAATPAAAPAGEEPVNSAPESPRPSVVPDSTSPAERDRRTASYQSATEPDAVGDAPRAGAQADTAGSAAGQAQHRDGNDLPDWLRMLSQRTFGCELPAVSRLAEQVIALKDLPARIATEPEEAACILLTRALEPLLPLLGQRYADGLPDIPETWGAIFLEARQPLLEWLGTSMELALVAPARGDGFDARTMEALETRRTVHAKEDETVAKLERIGVVWRARPLIRAQVVRYTTGGIA